MLSREKIDLIGPLAIVQGETYRQLIWTVPGDKTGWTPRGQIRTALLRDNGELLAEYYFDTPVYDEESDTTNIYPYLTPNQTVTLAKTKYQGTGEITKRNIYYHDIELEYQGEVFKLAPGVVQVTGEVTDGTSPPTYPDPIVYLQAGNNLSELENPEEAITNLGLDDVVRTGDIEDFETSDQLDERDLENRKWGNLADIPTWITNATEFGQSLINAATAAAAKILLGLDNVNNTSDADKPISDATLDALIALDEAKESADPTILKEADIGDSVQPYDENTVIDADYAAVTTLDSDTIEFELNEQELTGSVKDGSITTEQLSEDVNEGLTKADNAVQLTGDQTVAGIKTFTSRSLFSDNPRINGVEHFYRSTKPTVRGDGSALVVGDVLINSNGNYTWNGLVWIQELGWEAKEYRGFSSSGTNERIYNINGSLLTSTGRRLTEITLSTPTGLSLTNCRYVQLSGNTIVATGNNSGNFCSQVSTDNGANWGSVNTIKIGGTTKAEIVLLPSGHLVAGVDNELWESTNGITWSLIYTFPVTVTQLGLFVTASGALLCGVYTTSNTFTGKIYRGIRSGSWTFTEVQSSRNFHAAGQFATGRIIGVSFFSSPGIVSSDDDGVTWNTNSITYPGLVLRNHPLITINGRFYYIDRDYFIRYINSDLTSYAHRSHIPSVNFCPGFHTNTFFAMGGGGGSYDRLIELRKQERVLL